MAARALRDQSLSNLTPKAVAPSVRIKGARPRMGDVALVEAAIAARLKANAPAPSHSQWVNARYGNGYRGYGDGAGHERSASGTSSSASSGYRSGPQLRPPPLAHRPSLTGLVQVRTKDTGFEYWTTATLFQRVELGLFTVLSQIDFALHVGVAISAINVDHSWYTQGFWYVAFMMLTCILVAWLLVRLVSKITAGGSAAGVELQNKLQTKYESSAALLLLSLIQPELLLLLLPEPRSHHITLLLLDGFRSLLEGLPFLLMSLLFITRPNAFGGDATMASVLAIISMGWTVITLALKLFRLLLVGYAHTHTAEVRKELSEVKAKLEEERRQRGEEQQELYSLRSYNNYGDPQQQQQQNGYENGGYAQEGYDGYPQQQNGYGETHTGTRF